LKSGRRLEDKFNRVATKNGSVFAGTSSAEKKVAKLTTESSRFEPKKRDPIRAESDPIDIP
jgi:hypothetical protein